MAWCLLPCACNFFQRGEIIKNRHFELYSSPAHHDAFFNSSERYKRVVIVATNDLLGHISSNREWVSPQKSPALSYPVGGIAIWARYIEILRRKFPGQILLLDAGNIYQGTLISDFDRGESVVTLYNQLNYDALTIGHRDFAFGPLGNNQRLTSTTNKKLFSQDPQGQLKKNIAQHHSPYVMSNIIDLKTASLIQWPNIHPYIIKEINGLKVAIIGGISSWAWKTIRKEHLRGLYIRKLQKSLIKYSHSAREKGAQIVVALLHAGGWCGQRLMKKYHLNQYQVNFNPRGKDFCNPKHEVFQIINDLPAGTIDAIVAGHSRSKIANFYQDIPVIQAFSDGRFFGRMELVYDLYQKKVDKRKTLIHQPTKLCHQFLVNSQDCYGDNPEMQHQMKYKKLLPATFLGELIYPLPSIAKMIARYEAKIKARSQQKIVQFDQSLGKTLLQPMVFGSIISYSIRKATNAQIGLTLGRKILPKNRPLDHLTYQDIYQALPQEGRLSRVSLSGRELKLLVEVATAQEGHKTGQFSGLKVVVHQKTLQQRDLDGDGKKEEWEQSRLKSVRLADGEKIADHKFYTLGIQDFFSENNGGDYSFIFSNIAPERKTIFYHKTNRQALMDLLQSLPHGQAQQTKAALEKIIARERNWLITI